MFKVGTCVGNNVDIVNGSLRFSNLSPAKNLVVQPYTIVAIYTRWQELHNRFSFVFRQELTSMLLNLIFWSTMDAVEVRMSALVTPILVRIQRHVSNYIYNILIVRCAPYLKFDSSLHEGRAIALLWQAIKDHE